MNRWSKDVPEENGYYWFYGNVYNSGTRFALVKILCTPFKTFASMDFIEIDDFVVFEKEHINGYFQKIDRPTVPEV